MKKIYSLLLLGGLLFFGAEGMQGAVPSKIYVKNIHPSSWAGTDLWEQGSYIMYAYFFKSGSDTHSDFVSHSAVVYGTEKTAGAIYEFEVPSGTWDRILLIRDDDGTPDWTNDGQTHDLTLPTTGNNFLINYTSTGNTKVEEWSYYDASELATNMYINIVGGSGTQFTKATVSATSATVTLVGLEAGKDYEFYLQSAASGETLKNTGTMVANNCTNWPLYTDADNPHFKTTIAGDYTFTYSLSENTLSLTYPTAYERAVNSGAWGTVCFPVDAELSSTYVAHVYSINYKDGEHLYLTEEANLSLRGGRPYIFKAKSGVSKITATLSSTGTNYESVEWHWNGLYGKYDRTPFTGWDVEKIYIVTDTEIQRASQASGVLPNRAYIALNMVPDEAVTSAPGLPIIAMPLEPNNATDINSIEASEKAVKFFENGQLFIQKNGVVYDMTGRIVR